MEKYEEINKMTIEECVERYNKIAGSTVDNLDFWSNEIFRKISNEINKKMIKMTKNIQNLTIAIAFVSRFVTSKDEYFRIKEELVTYVQQFIKKQSHHKVTVVINAADNYEKDILYLTVTGTSAECGDDGQVGRGNRANGLITPYRPMTLEATAGKNPITHTGKLYNLTANNISAELTKDPDISGAECYLVSRIGTPITEPGFVHIRIHSNLSKKTSDEKCKEIIKKHLSQIPQLWTGILEGKYSLF